MDFGYSLGNNFFINGISSEQPTEQIKQPTKLKSSLNDKDFMQRFKLATST